MQGELREKVVSLVKRTEAEITCDSVMRYGTRIVGAEATADAIIALLRDALLSDEVVEAGARAITVSARGPNDGPWGSDPEVDAWVTTHARAALSAALAKIGAQNV